MIGDWSDLRCSSSYAYLQKGVLWKMYCARRRVLSEPDRPSSALVATLEVVVYQRGFYSHRSLVTRSSIALSDQIECMKPGTVTQHIAAFSYQTLPGILDPAETHAAPQQRLYCLKRWRSRMVLLSNPITNANQESKPPRLMIPASGLGQLHCQILSASTSSMRPIRTSQLHPGSQHSRPADPGSTGDGLRKERMSLDPSIQRRKLSEPVTASTQTNSTVHRCISSRVPSCYVLIGGEGVIIPPSVSAPQARMDFGAARFGVRMFTSAAKCRLVSFSLLTETLHFSLRFTLCSNCRRHAVPGGSAARE